MTVEIGGIPYSDLGALQVVPRPQSGVPAGTPRVPPGWAVDPVLRCAYVEAAGTQVPSTAINRGGWAFTEDGALYVTTDDQTGPFVWIGGFKTRYDGALCIKSGTPDPYVNPYIGGWAADLTGPAIVGGDGPTFYAPLTTSIVPTVGNGPATFTRATTATVEDWEGIIRTVKSGEARFQGARRVENVVNTSSENLSSGWSLQAGGTGSAPVATATTAVRADGVPGTVTRLQFALNGGNTSSDTSRCRQTSSASPACVCSGWIRSNTDQTYNINGRASSGGVRTTLVVTPQWQRFTWSGVGGSGDAIEIGLTGGRGDSDSADILVYGMQCEKTAGQSNQNPSEYVSVGVASAPLYHGAGVDGVKYFPYENGNTVGPGNVVNEARGPAIPDSELFGYLAEGARTNLLLWSEDFDNAAWSKVDTTITTDATTAPDGSSTADLCTEGTAGTAFVARAVTATAGANYATSRWFKRGNHDWIQLIINDGLGNSARAMFNIANGTVGDTPGAGTGVVVNASVEAFPNGWYRCKLVANMASAGTNITSFSASALNGSNSGRQNNATYYMWGAQFENNVSFASSYIPTAGSAVTRNADVLTYPFAGNASATVGTAYAELGTEWAAATGSTQVAIGFNTGTLAHPLWNSTGMPSTQMRIGDGTNTATKSSLTDMSTGICKRASSWGAGISVTGDGATVATGTFDGAMGNTILVIGAGAASQTWFGTFRNVTIWQRQFTDAELQAITS